MWRVCPPPKVGRWLGVRWSSDYTYGLKRGAKHSYRSGETRGDLAGSAGSVPQDANAPKDPAQRREWLKQQTSGYKLRSPDQQATWDKAMYREVDFVDNDPMHPEDRKEQAWLAKRQKEVNKRGMQVMVGAGLAISLWILNMVYRFLTERAGRHPAHGVHIGALCELKLTFGDKVFKDPVVIGLFTDRAPLASENFHRLCTAKNDEGKTLAGTSIFKVDSRAGLYGGSFADDARGGAVVVPGYGGRLPPEDSNLPPFRWAVGTCAKAFYKNSGMNSVFCIFTTDNPSFVGNHESEGFREVEQARRKQIGSFFGLTTKQHIQRDAFDAVDDGVYVFGTVLRGQHVLEYIMANSQPSLPLLKPAVPITVASCGVIEMPQTEKRELLQKLQEDEGPPEASPQFRQ